MHYDAHYVMTIIVRDVSRIYWLCFRPCFSKRCYLALQKRGESRPLQEAIWELIVTEYKYIMKLDIITEVFIKPLSLLQEKGLCKEVRILSIGMELWEIEQQRRLQTTPNNHLQQ